VHAVRHLIAKRHLAVLICAAALLLKVLVPSGFMIANDHGRLTIAICSGTVPSAEGMDMPGMHGDMTGHGKSKDHGKTEMPCAFSGLSAASLAATDPVQLAALLAFVVAVGLAGTKSPPALSRRAQFRPPLRGPPTRL
jgi:hypothetical protein